MKSIIVGLMVGLLLNPAILDARANQLLENMTLKAGIDSSVPLPNNVTTGDFSWMRLAGWVDTIHVGVGARIKDSDISIGFGSGFRFLSGNFEEGQTFSNGQSALDYSYAGIPLRVEVVWEPTDKTITPFLLGWVGGEVAKASYTDVGLASYDSGWGFLWGTGAHIGGSIAVNDFLRVRAFAHGQFGAAVSIPFTPQLSRMTAGIGVALVGYIPIEATPIQKSAEDEDILPAAYENLMKKQQAEQPVSSVDDSNYSPQVKKAFELFRQADAARNHREYSKAATFYRQGIQTLPPSEDARKNVESPIRVDWAQCLLKLGKKSEAITVLKGALIADPENEQAKKLLKKFGVLQDSQKTRKPIAPVTSF